MSTLLIIGFSVFFVYIFVVLVMFFGQERMVFHPIKKISHLPSDLKLPFREVTFKTSDKLKLRGWMVGDEGPGDVLLFCHGNAGNISHNLNFLSMFYLLGLRTFIFDYRGYGQSEGIPSEEGTFLDAEAAWNYLVKTERIPRDRIILYGHSLGASVATFLATRIIPKALIIEAAFTSVPDLGKHLFPFFPVRILCKFNYNTREFISNVTIPKLVIHSLYDETIPFRHGEVLYKNANEPKQFLQIFGSHNDGFVNCAELYMVGIRSFLADINSPSTT